MRRVYFCSQFTIWLRHPFLAGTGKSTIQVRGDIGVRSEALLKRLLKTHLHVCGGAGVSGMPGGRQQVGTQATLCFLCSEPGRELRQAGSDLPRSRYSLWVCSPSPHRGSRVSVFCLPYLLELKSHISPSCWIVLSSCPTISSN